MRRGPTLAVAVIATALAVVLFPWPSAAPPGPPPPPPPAERAPVAPADGEARVPVRIRLDPAPERIAPLQHCRQPALLPEIFARLELSHGRVPEWARPFATAVPIAPVREVASAIGLRPARAARLVAKVDPWFAWTLAQAEAGWRRAEDRDRSLADWARDHEEVAGLVEGLAERSGDPGLAELAEVERMIADAWRLRAGGAPETDVARLREHLLGSPSSAVRALALQGLCVHDAPLGASDHERLRAEVAATPDAAHAEAVAAFALRSAWNAGDPAEVDRWWPILEEARATCRAGDGPLDDADGLARRSEPTHACLGDADWSELAVRVGRGGAWNDALRAAAHACHARDPLPPAAPIVATGRWRDGWTFDPAPPFVACVAERARVAPPAALEVLLDVAVVPPGQLPR